MDLLQTTSSTNETTGKLNLDSANQFASQGIGGVNDFQKRLEEQIRIDESRKNWQAQKDKTSQGDTKLAKKDDHKINEDHPDKQASENPNLQERKVPGETEAEINKTNEKKQLKSRQATGKAKEDNTDDKDHVGVKNNDSKQKAPSTPLLSENAILLATRSDQMSNKAETDLILDFEKGKKNLNKVKKESNQKPEFFGKSGLNKNSSEIKELLKNIANKIQDQSNNKEKISNPELKEPTGQFVAKKDTQIKSLQDDTQLSPKIQSEAVVQNRKWEIHDRRVKSESAEDSRENKDENSLNGINIKTEKKSKGKSQDRDQKLPGQTQNPTMNPAGSVDSNQTNSTFESSMDSSNENKAINKELFRSLVQKAKINIQKDGSSTASIRLNPGKLGSVLLNLNVDKSVLQGSIIVETQGAMKLIKQELDSLKLELKQQGIIVENLTLKIRESSSTSMNSFDTREGSSELTQEFDSSTHKGDSEQSDELMYAQPGNNEIALQIPDDYGQYNGVNAKDTLIDISI